MNKKENKKEQRFDLPIENLERVEKLNNDWGKCLNYFSSTDLKNRIPRNVDFFEGRQWAKPTASTKNLPRPVFNVIEMCVLNRASNILGSPVKLNYIADDDQISTRRFSDFAEYQQKEMKQDENNYQAVHDSCIKGTYIYYFYWDELAIGKKGKYEGALRCEMLDPLDVGFSNPSVQDCQKQDWIIVRKRMTISKAKKLAEEKYLESFITPDGGNSKAYEDQFFLDQNEIVTVLFRFFKKDGEVYFEAGTKDVMLFSPRCINPNVKTKSLYKEGVNEETNEVDGDELEEQNQDEKMYYKASLYPFEVGSLKPKNTSIYGRSFVEDLIPVQKTINFLFALATLNCQQLGSPKTVVKNGALKGQVITNKVGEVLVDHTPIGSQGIYTLNITPFTQGALSLAPSMIDLIRTVTNSTEVMTGDTIGREMSGVAISQLQAVAEKPTAMERQKFWRSLERNGKIMEMFYKLYYEDKDYDYSLTASEEEAYRMQNQIPPKKVRGVFNGKDFIDKDFNIIVEAGAGTQYSEIQTMSMLDNLLLNKLIDLKTYTKFYPRTAMAFKEEMEEHIRATEESELYQLRQAVAQYEQQIGQMTEYSQQQEKTIKELGSQLSKSAKQNQSLIDEFTQKINLANQIITGLGGHGGQNQG